MKNISPDSFILDDFEGIKPHDSEALGAILDPYRLCDYSFVNLCTWGPSYDIRGAMADDHLLLLYGGGGMLFFPVGPVPEIELLETLSRRMAYLGGRGHFVLSLDENFNRVSGLLEKYEPIMDPEDANYIYSIPRLSSLDGRKLRKKRNHLSQFARNFPGHFVRELGPSDLEDCVLLSEAWRASRPELTGEELMMERKAMKTAFDCFEAFSLMGLGLFHEDRMCGFAVYSRQAQDMAMIHFEKYDPGLPGSSQQMTWELSRHLQSGFRFMNREQDLGIEGLRRAKMSWDPCEILCPSILVWREGTDTARPWEEG